jgi:hypothetical protein
VFHFLQPFYYVNKFSPDAYFLIEERKRNISHLSVDLGESAERVWYMPAEAFFVNQLTNIGPSGNWVKERRICDNTS